MTENLCTCSRDWHRYVMQKMWSALQLQNAHRQVAAKCNVIRLQKLPWQMTHKSPWCMVDKPSFLLAFCVCNCQVQC